MPTDFVPATAVCLDKACDKLHLSNGHHYGCECFSCTHEIIRLKNTVTGKVSRLRRSP